MATKSINTKVTLRITSFVLALLMNIAFYTLVVILIVNVSKEAYQFTYQLYGPVTVESEPGRDIMFQINKGESSMDIAKKLEINRAIVNKYSFFIKLKLEDYVIIPGTYLINSSMTYEEILETITDYSKAVIKDEAEATDQKDKK